MSAGQRRVIEGGRERGRERREREGEREKGRERERERESLKECGGKKGERQRVYEID